MMDSEGSSNGTGATGLDTTAAVDADVDASDDEDAAFCRST
jgi:hypothetical protein